MQQRSGGHFRSSLMEYRWLVCVAAGMLLYFGLPAGWGAAIRGAAAWIALVAAYLGWTGLAIAAAPPQRLRQLARREDPRRAIIFAFAVLSAAASLVAVTVLLHKQTGEDSSGIALRIGLVAGVVFSAWLVTHTIFAIHYAHGFYGDGPAPGADDDRGGLQFPGDLAAPDFWDFLYFSLVIGMTCQVSDVQITGPHMRRLATVHGVLSFFFNTVILAITINLLVNAI